MPKKPTLEDIKQQQKEIAEAYKHVFETKEGKKILKDLEDMFYHADLRAQTAEMSMYNLGLRDAVRHIHLTLEEDINED